MPDITKAIRLSHEEWERIAKFLKQNPFFDFSSLARTAIHEFVRNPKLVITGVDGPSVPNLRKRKASAVGGSSGRV